MRTLKTVQRELEVPDEVFCNLCGGNCRDTNEPRNRLGLHAEEMGGYGSFFPQDLERWEFDLCEPCLGALVSFFTIAPSVSDVGQFHDEPCTSRAYDVLHGADASKLQSWEHKVFLRAMERRAAMQGADIDPTARVRAALRMLPSERGTITDARLEQMQGLCEGGNPFKQMNDDPESPAVEWADGEFCNVLNDEPVLVSGLRGALRDVLHENDSLRTVLSTMLELVDEEMKAKINAVLTAKAQP